jgi:hypothetical protein
MAPLMDIYDILPAKYTLPLATSQPESTHMRVVFRKQFKYVHLASVAPQAALDYTPIPIQ